MHVLYPDETEGVYVKHMQHLDKTRLQHTSENTDEILGIDLYNICVQPLQQMQHPDLLLQHLYETIVTYL